MIFACLIAVRLFAQLTTKNRTLFKLLNMGSGSPFEAAEKRKFSREAMYYFCSPINLFLGN